MVNFDEIENAQRGNTESTKEKKKKKKDKLQTKEKLFNLQEISHQQD